MTGRKMDRIVFLQTRIRHNEIQREEVHQCSILLGQTNVDIGAHHMGKALQAVYHTSAEIGLAIEADRDELASLEVVAEGCHND